MKSKNTKGDSARIGLLFSKKRDNLGLSIEDIAKSIKVNTFHLEAIENGDYSKFPSEGFARAYFIKYSNYLSLDYSFPSDAYKNDRENEIEIKYTGLRAGEKLNEKLFASEEFIKTGHPRIFVSSERDPQIFEIEKVCRSLEKACNASDHKAIKSIVEGCIDGFELENISLDPRW